MEISSLSRLLNVKIAAFLELSIQKLSKELHQQLHLFSFHRNVHISIFLSKNFKRDINLHIVFDLQ